MSRINCWSIWSYVRIKQSKLLIKIDLMTSLSRVNCWFKFNLTNSTDRANNLSKLILWIIEQSKLLIQSWSYEIIEQSKLLVQTWSYDIIEQSKLLIQSLSYEIIEQSKPLIQSWRYVIIEQNQLLINSILCKNRAE